MIKFTEIKKQNRLILLLLLASTGWLTSLVWLVTIPTDPKNAILFGLSLARLVLAFLPLLMAITALSLVWKMRHSSDWADNLSILLCRVPVFVGLYVAFILVALLFVASFVLVDTGQIAAFSQRLQPLLFGGTVNLGLFLLYPVIFGPDALIYVNQKTLSEPTIPIKPVWQPPLVLAVIVLLVYIAAGAFTYWRFVQGNPLSDRLHYDFGYYMQGLDAALAGSSPYSDLSLGTGFLYPLPALLLVEFFGHPPLIWLRQVFYLLFNLVLLGGMTWGVARQYHLTLRQVWWWFPLVLGFAPTLEMLHAGQINMITQFGIFLLFIWEASRPTWGGIGLALGIVTKVSPSLFLPYLLTNRRWQTAAAAVGGLVLFSALAVLRYGWAPLAEYVDVFQSLMTRLPLGENPQALASKLFVVGLLDSAHAQTFHSLLTLYFMLVLFLSALGAYLTRVREPFFIIVMLSMMLSSNIVWYHHYVFFLLPVLVWIAWKRLDPWVVAWCFVGMIAIQCDRWGLTTGLLAHVFGHLTILWLLAGQMREMMTAVKLTQHNA